MGGYIDAISLKLLGQSTGELLMTAYVGISSGRPNIEPHESTSSHPEKGEVPLPLMISKLRLDV